MACSGQSPEHDADHSEANEGGGGSGIALEVTRQASVIALVMGGFHLLSASRKQIDAIVLALRKLGVRQVAPSHCTGDLARRRFKEIYRKNYLDGGAGMVIRFASRPTLAR